MSSIFGLPLISGIKIASPFPRRRNLCAATFAVREPLGAAAPPCLMLPHYFKKGGKDMVYNFYSPAKDEVVSFNNRGGREETELMQDDKTMLVGSSHGWLALYNSRNYGMFLLNPVSGRRIDLPPLAGEFFFVKDVPEKLILSCPPDEEECRAVLILRGGIEVAFCSPGRSTRWTLLAGWSWPNAIFGVFNFFTSKEDSPRVSIVRCYIDFVYSAARKRFVALVFAWPPKIIEVEYWDISEPSCARRDRVERIDWVERTEPFHDNGDLDLTDCKLYIVPLEESGQLFIVNQYRFYNPNNIVIGNSNSALEDRKYYYDVYRIEDGGRLGFCSSLDDLSMFVGINSMAFQASPKLKRNCIHFADPNKIMDGGQYVEIFDHEKRSSSPIYFPHRYQKSQTSLTWITPSYF